MRVFMVIRGNKAIMGIGTLIIFIATILVAAVAAAVLISTSNVLQQRSLLVGQEARKAITDAVDVVSILSKSDSVSETFNDFEILVRLSPGSDPLQMRNFNIQYISPDFDEAANLHYSSNETFMNSSAVLTNSTYTDMFDIDDDDEVDQLIFLLNASGPSEGLYLNLTEFNGVWSDPILIPDISDAATTSVPIEYEDLPIIYDGDVYGYLDIVGTVSTDDTLDPNEINITLHQIPQDCDFSTLPPEKYYCFIVMNGNDDFVLGSGERFKIYYRVKDEHAMGIGEDLQFIFTTEKGRLSEARARTPDVVTSTKAKLWPLG